jgi:hypothetical protein
MTTSDTLGADLAEVLTPYRSCEFATVTSCGVPVAWPTIPFYDPAAGTFLITTSIGMPVKAFNIRRTPSVSLLFSDPTGSGSPSRPHVLVQGTAECPDEIHTSAEGVEAYWRHLYGVQPAGRLYSSNAVLRHLFDWYFFRLHITVTPQRVSVSEPPPASPGRSRLRPASAAGEVTRRILKQLPGYEGAVLSWADADGMPCSARTRLEGCDGDGLVVGRTSGRPLREGPASLLCHRHDERLWNLKSFGATGHIGPVGDRWVFTPERFLPGASSSDPRSLVRMVRSSRANARRYLDKRGLPWPDVPWHEYKALHGR